MPRKSKLSPAAVRRICASKESVKDLVARYGVTASYIYAIRRGHGRKGVAGTPTAAKGRREQKPTRARSEELDINALADALIDRVIARLKRK